MTEVQDVDVLIVGGGINGVGTFRDLCAQGVTCLLIEREDFCAGASQASSRLMHGGLKYLETGEFGLVRESATERNRLLANAPHYVAPLPCIVPVRSAFGGLMPSLRRFLRLPATMADRGFAIIAAGLTLYDIYGRRFRAMPRHRMLTRRALAREMPDLAPHITGAGLYYEGQITHAERLGLELVLDGEALHPDSRAVNHAQVLGSEGGVVRWSGGAVRPRVVINAGGAMIDAVNAALGIESQLMGGSKGSHLVVDNPRLLAALCGRMVYFGTADGRVNLLYPFLGRVLVGSTDLPVADPDAARCEADEEAYLIAAVAEVFPSIPIRPEEVVARFCGVRPLPRAEGTDIGLVTRDHSVPELALPGSGVPVLCLVGGKWTTFRAFAEQVTDDVLHRLGRSRRVSTAGMAIGGGLGFPRDAAGRAALVARLAALGGVTRARAEALLARYGTRAEALLALVAGEPETPLTAAPDYTREEIAWIGANERARSVEDVLRRRTTLALEGRASPALRAEVGALLGLD